MKERRPRRIKRDVPFQEIRRKQPVKDRIPSFEAVSEKIGINDNNLSEEEKDFWAKGYLSQVLIVTGRAEEAQPIFDELEADALYRKFDIEFGQMVVFIRRSVKTKRS